MTLFGCDSSNNNFSDISQVAPLIQNMQQTGFSWIEAKVSQGSDFQDEYWPATLAACQAIGFPVIGITSSTPATRPRKPRASSATTAATWPCSTSKTAQATSPTSGP
jgi:hypothetical protein